MSTHRYYTGGQKSTAIQQMNGQMSTRSRQRSILLHPDIQVIISGLIHREDCEVNNEIASISNQLESYCNCKNFLFVNNNNMKSSCLAKDKLHLNKTGNSIFAKNIINVLKKA